MFVLSARESIVRAQRTRWVSLYLAFPAFILGDYVEHLRFQTSRLPPAKLQNVERADAFPLLNKKLPATPKTEWQGAASATIRLVEELRPEQARLRCAVAAIAPSDSASTRGIGRPAPTNS